MIGYCDQCGCAIYTPEDVGFEAVTYQMVSKGAVPHVKYYYAPVHELLCRACYEEDRAVPYCAIEAAYQAWAEQ